MLNVVRDVVCTLIVRPIEGLKGFFAYSFGVNIDKHLKIEKARLPKEDCCVIAAHRGIVDGAFLQVFPCCLASLMKQ